jgi:hypothetical protein
MRPSVFQLRPCRRLRGTFDFAAIADRVRMPWRFLARHVAVDGLAGR